MGIVIVTQLNKEWQIMISATIQSKITQLNGDTCWESTYDGRQIFGTARKEDEKSNTIQACMWKSFVIVLEVVC